MACGSSSDSSPGSGAPSSAGSGAATATEIVVENYIFPAITAAPEARLTFINRDDESHTVTADDGSFKIGPFDNKTPEVLTAPATVGSFAFHCEIHPTMHGTLVVSNP